MTHMEIRAQPAGSDLSSVLSQEPLPIESSLQPSVPFLEWNVFDSTVCILIRIAAEYIFQVLWAFQIIVNYYERELIL